MKNKVEIHPYDPEWPLRFEREKERIIRTLDPSPLPIEHIGSTSIPGMDAKPILDILLGVDHLTDFPRLTHPLAQAGYEYIPKPELENRRFFKKEERDGETYHLHLCEWEGQEWTEKLMFRDYLRAHPDTASDYKALKVKLSFLHKNDRSLYTEKKEPFIHTVIENAKKKG